MIFLIFMILFQGINIYIYLNYNCKIKKSFYIINAIPVWFLLGFRDYHVGSDTMQYISIFNTISKNSFIYALNYSSKEEPGLYILIKLISYISKNPTVFLCIIYLILLTVILYFFYKNCKYPIIPFYLWTCLGGFDFLITGMRQCFAMAICLIAYEFAKNKKTVFFILLVILAAQFHKSAFLFLPVYFLQYLKNTKKTILLWLSLAIIILTCMYSIQTYINNILYGGDLLDSYTELEYTGNGFLMIGYISLFATVFIINRGELIKNKKDNLLFNTSLIAWLFWIGRSVTRVAERPGMYFMFAYYITLSNLLFIKNNYNNIYKVIMIIIFPMLLFIYRNLDFAYNFIFAF